MLSRPRAAGTLSVGGVAVGGMVEGGPNGCCFEAVAEGVRGVEDEVNGKEVDMVDISV